MTLKSKSTAPSFEGAKINYHGDLALSWQTLWVGPFLVEGPLGSLADVSEAQPSMPQRNQVFCKDRPSDFLADSGSSSAEYVRIMDRAGFTHGSVSYNKWISVPERTAAALPETAWAPARKTRWRDGREITEQHAGIRPTPGESPFTFPLAVARWKKDGEMFWRYALVAHDNGRSGAEAIMARQRLKGGKEPLFKEVLRGLDLHPPALRKPDGPSHVLRHRRPGLQPDQSRANPLPAG